MDNEEQLDPSKEPYLAEEIPDSSGPPQPVKHKLLQSCVLPTCVGLVIGGCVFLPMITSVNATAGATRSAKLRLQAREQEIEQAIEEEQNSLALQSPQTQDDNNEDPSNNR
jgi:hypothetical protein